MPSSVQTKIFFDSEEGKWLRAELITMVANPKYNTLSSYTTASTDKLLFVDKHMNYMASYPATNHRQYLLNLKLKTKAWNT